MPEWIHQIDELFRYHAPGGGLPVPTWVAVVTVVLGLLLSLAGAQLVRTVFTLAFLGGGAAAGAVVAERFDVSVIAGIAIGAVILGIIGYLLFRLWIAGLTGVVAAVVAAVVTAAPQLPGLWEAFESHRTRGGAPAGEYRLLSAEQQQANADLDLVEYAQLFLEFTRTQQPELVHRAMFVAAVALVLGIIIALLVHRWAMVLGTIALGTVLTLAGAWLLAYRHWPAPIDWCREQPRWALGALGVWLIIAIACQRRGFRSVATAVQAPPPPQQKPA
ncbi:MAG: hypothetical protein JXA69_07230 [Phycisphaerae bacterium]|nr:hypothetical protein [Phycisphaerae bacterium]